MSPASVALPAEAPTGWIAQFTAVTDPSDMQAAVEAAGGVFGFPIPGLAGVPMAYLRATPSQAEALRGHPSVRHVEWDAPITFHDAESKQHIRSPSVTDPGTGVKDANNDPVDGRGIGVAVVDTGVDGLHSDLDYGSNLVRNCKIESNVVCLEMENTDLTSGHGTHVAAIVAGSGTLDPLLTGVAPGAKLYGVSIAEGTTTAWAVQGFAWIHNNLGSFNPPVKVVTNSWGTDTTYEADSGITLWVNQLVSDGLVVVFAAGNRGGDGTSIQTSAECQNPTPGVICVANYDDLGAWTGTRNGAIASTSSRGLSSSAATWPDLSAPGTAVMSARTPVGATTGFGSPTNSHTFNYVQLSGTSQAAPHVAAVAALMLQKHPSWSPATVELKMKCTAYKYASGASYSATTLAGCSSPTSSYDKGFGLVDAYAAVTAT